MEKMYDVEATKERPATTLEWVRERMLELLSGNVDVENWKITDRGREIIDKISDYAEKTRMFQENKDRGEIFSDLPAQRVFVYMLARAVNAPTSIHRDMGVLLIMPFVRQKLREESGK